ncbi:MAG TPA: hypothetical protein VGI46_16230 [Candidatus Acidoferrum sp.]
MPDCIRIADLKADRSLLTDLLTENLSPDAGGRRFDWLYLENPHGPARAWVVTEEGTGRGLGAAAAFPKIFFVDNCLCSGFVLGDFCIDQRYRSLGLALRLQRASLEQLNSSPGPLAYDFPSDHMMAIYRRMQIPVAGEIVRWAKPLRTNRKIGTRIKSSMLAGFLAAPLNQLLAWKDSASFGNAAWNIENHKGTCGEEFTELARTIGSFYGSCVERSAQHLNWRYLEHPLLRHELLTARSGEQLRGYVVFTQYQQDARIVDLFGFSDTSMWTALVGRVVSLLRDRGLNTLSFPALAANPWTGLLPRWGFRPREASALVVYNPRTGTQVELNSKDTWFLMDGDRES